MLKIAPVHRVLSDFRLYITISEHVLERKDIQAITDTFKAKNITRSNKTEDTLEYKSEPGYHADIRDLWNFTYLYLADMIRQHGIDFEMDIVIMHYCMECQLSNCDTCQRYLT